MQRSRPEKKMVQRLVRRAARIGLAVAVLLASVAGTAQGQTLRYSSNNVAAVGAFMLDESTGWAVGALGSLRHTADGGQTWVHQLGPGTGNFADVWASDEDNAWVVGSAGTILKWDGLTWAPEASGTTQSLNSVWGLGPGAIWAVGTAGTILHQDGSGWAAQASGTSAVLSDVWAADGTDVWAVGVGGLILHWDGAVWTPQASGTTADLNSVWGSSASDVWAAGNGGTLIHWDGSTWSASTSGTSQPLRGLWGSGTSDVWAVGINVYLRWDGSTWQVTASPVPFRNISGSGAVVRATALGAATLDSRIFAWDGTDFVPQTVATPGSTNELWADDSGNVWAALTSGLYRLVGSHWQLEATPSAVGTNAVGVWGTGPDDVWLAANTGVDAGGIAHWDGTSWTEQDDGTASMLRGLWGVDGTHIWAVGDGGTIVAWDGTSWNPQLSGTTEGLADVWASDANNAWAVGTGGTILKFDGTSWTPQASGTTVGLGVIYGLDSNHVWVGGAGGTMLFWDGSQWTPQSTGTTQTFTGIWAHSPTAVWATTNGTLRRWDGSTWTLLFNGSFRELYGTGPGEIWAGGLQALQGAIFVLTSCGDGVLAGHEYCDQGSDNGTESCCTAECRLLREDRECRASAGDCDVAETCDGVAAECPADAFATGGVCRAASGVCDAAESCDGTTADCPADGFATGGVCRAATDVCDAAESCDGTTANCPADALATGGVCRAATDPCDVAESCTGASASCPADTALPDGTSCSDGDACTENDVCASGTCGGDASDICYLCPETPLTGCAAAPRGRLRMIDSGASRQLRWQWGEGTTTLAALGDPVADTGYRLCVYADDAPVGGLSVTPGPGWRKNRRGFTYRADTADGVHMMRLREGSGRARIGLQARGPSMLLPELPLTYGDAVKVQLSKNPAGGGECWENEFAGAANRNSDRHFFFSNATR